MSDQQSSDNASNSQPTKSPEQRAAEQSDFNFKVTMVFVALVALIGGIALGERLLPAQTTTAAAPAGSVGASQPAPSAPAPTQTASAQPAGEGTAQSSQDMLDTSVKYAIKPARNVLEDGPSEALALAASLYPLSDDQQAEALVVRQACAACHSFDEGGPNYVAGPNLYGVFGRDVASVEGYGLYSEALKAYGGVWTADRLDRYLTHPAGLVEGTSMAYPGMPWAEQRALLLAYLKGLDGADLAFAADDTVAPAATPVEAEPQAAPEPSEQAPAEPAADDPAVSVEAPAEAPAAVADGEPAGEAPAPAESQTAEAAPDQSTTPVETDEQPSVEEASEAAATEPEPAPETAASDQAVTPTEETDAATEEVAEAPAAATPAEDEAQTAEPEASQVSAQPPEEIAEDPASTQAAPAEATAEATETATETADAGAVEAEAAPADAQTGPGLVEDPVAEAAAPVEPAPADEAAPATASDEGSSGEDRLSEMAREEPVAAPAEEAAPPASEETPQSAEGPVVAAAPAEGAAEQTAPDAVAEEAGEAVAEPGAETAAQTSTSEAPAPEAASTEEAVEETSAPVAEQAAIVAEVASLTPLSEADRDAALQVRRRCSACHGFEKGQPNRVGPNLYGIVGKDIGSVEGFRYSTAMSEYPGVWTLEELDGYLENPRAHMPGNRMGFGGLSRPEDRALIIAYLSELAD